MVTFLWPAPGPLLLVTDVMAGPTAVQVKLVDPTNPALSVTVTVTANTPEWRVAPVIVPVVGEIDSPVGSPVADQVRVAVDEVSLADSATGTTDTPTRLVWLPGPVTATVLVIVQVKDAVPTDPTLSVTVMVTA